MREREGEKDVGAGCKLDVHIHRVSDARERRERAVRSS